MQAPGERIGPPSALVELPSRMQAGVHDLDDRDLFLWMGPNRNASPIIGHADASILVLGHQDGARMTG